MLRKPLLLASSNSKAAKLRGTLCVQCHKRNHSSEQRDESMRKRTGVLAFLHRKDFGLLTVCLSERFTLPMENVREFAVAE